MIHNSLCFGTLMFLHFYMYDVLKYLQNCNKDSLITKGTHNFFLYP